MPLNISGCFFNNSSAALRGGGISIGLPTDVIDADQLPPLLMSDCDFMLMDACVGSVLYLRGRTLDFEQVPLLELPTQVVPSIELSDVASTCGLSQPLYFGLSLLDNADVNSTLKLLGTSGDVPFMFDGDGAGLTLDGIQLEVNEEAPVCPGSCEVLMLEEEQTDVDQLSYAFPVFDGMGTNVSDYLFAVGTAANQTNARPFGSIDVDLDEVCNDTM